ncbi:sulfotransferase family 5A, member 1 [Takifugu rubripes]|uniref:Sulfotransferase n=1 Tax=Takifugu rubripes TaxID=31033 RepID=H2V4T3_TAKRU|nr:sulfotransferase family cytosolic 2B member 1-like [Takifugu rubripes]|eukprot:XP_003969975.1 PREDICTED: sulfotransferase family cytosolic 2B member 1-like [Takifugu rubripes]
MESFGGVLFPGGLHTQESLKLAVDFPFRDTDVLIVSYPKSGTTWMQEIITLILGRGDPHLSHTVPNWARAPWLEHHYFAELQEASSTQPRVFTTHLPNHLLVPALQEPPGSNVKVIYVSRNPKDVAVSFYHFHKLAVFLPEFSTFEEFLHHFLDGRLCYGSWFDHIKGWTDQRRAPSNLLHVTYEEMSLDLSGTIQKVSSYLRRPLVEDEVNSCVKHCSFSSMKVNKMVNYSLVAKDIMDHSKGSFMRKGKVGDWKTMFTEEQDEYFNSVFKSKMDDCALDFVWEEQQKPPQD